MSMSIQLKSPAEIAKLREANLIVADVLDQLEAVAKPGPDHASTTRSNLSDPSDLLDRFFHTDSEAKREELVKRILNRELLEL